MAGSDPHPHPQEPVPAGFQQPAYPQAGAPYPQQAYAPYPPPKQGMSGAKIALIVCGFIFGVLLLFGVLVGVLAVATIPKLTEAKDKLEIKQMGDLYAGLQQISADDRKKKQIRGQLLGRTEGADFWYTAIDEGLLDSSLSRKLVSLHSNDVKHEPPVPASGISYTAPKGGELFMVMSRKGSERCVLFTWNSRNWRNAKGERVPIAWSDSDAIQWVTFEEAQADWGISRAEWDDPAGKLFGKKAPFQFTYE
jgi:hypothetical protein